MLLVAIVAPWVLAIAAWPDLPARFPIHFDAGGVADGWAAKSLLAWFVFGSARVAAGMWETLPSWPSWTLIGAVLACAVLLAFAGTRAVRREVGRAGG